MSVDATRRVIAELDARILKLVERRLRMAKRITEGVDQGRERDLRTAARVAGYAPALVDWYYDQVFTWVRGPVAPRCPGNVARPRSHG